MGKFQIGEPVDAAGALEDLLRHNGFDFRREGGRFRLAFSDRGRKWETVCACLDQAVVIYGYYPFPIADRARAADLCAAVDRQVLFGSMLLLGDRMAFRTGADLFDGYSAYEHIARALEYGAGVLVRFWNEAAACADSMTGDPDGMSDSI